VELMTKLILIALIALLALNFFATPAQTGDSTGSPSASGGGCANPGAEVWAQMNVVERAAHGLRCAAGGGQ
jgi:hypothetical protein